MKTTKGANMKTIPTFTLSINDICKTEKQKAKFRALLKSQGANSMIVNSKDEMTFCKNNKKLTTLNKKGKLLDIHTNKERNNENI
tara:strand:- start:106 stop:360 length:255 start_codon:yes stop_codon:yes gene_type:complete